MSVHAGMRACVRCSDFGLSYRFPSNWSADAPPVGAWLEAAARPPRVTPRRYLEPAAALCITRGWQ